MAVTEALMSLFIKELVNLDRVMSVVKRLDNIKTSSTSSASPASPASPTDQEEALLLWVNRSCQALKKKAEAELDQEVREPREASVRKAEKADTLVKEVKIVKKVEVG